MKPLLSIRLALTASLAVGACGGGGADEPADAPPLDVTVVTSVATSRVTAAPATVVAAQKADLATRISGTIRRMTVDVGAHVAAGDTLVVLDTDEIDARIRSAEAAARLARQSHDRIAALARDGAATRQELDDAEARLQMAEAALRDARAQRQYVVLTAPFSGVVTARRADPGDLAAPGSPILTLLGGAELKVEIDLPGELAGTVAPGDVLPVVTPDPGSRLAARVVRVVPALDRESRRFRVEARFEDEAAARARITPGAYVRVELEDPSGTTRWVPEDVVVRRGQLQGVFAVEGERLRLRWIRPGQRRADAVEVLAGPPADALLVRDPPADLEDGRPVGSVRRVEWSPPAGRPVTPTPERAP